MEKDHMADSRKTKPKFTSEKGHFRFPKIDKPDYGTDDYPKPDGEFNVQLMLGQDSVEFKRMEKRLAPLHAAALEAAQEEYDNLPASKQRKAKAPELKPLFEPLFEKDADGNETETGRVAFKFATKASGEYKKGPKAGQRWNKKLPVYDAKGKLMVKVPEVWGGTTGKLSYTTRPYYIAASGLAGLKLDLEAAQIIDLVAGGQRTASEFGFGEEEGYEHEDTAVETKEDDDEFADESSEDGGDEDGADF
jgi:hypothetical protein